MSPELERIEIAILRAIPALNLRPTLDRAAEAGRLLVAAKELLPHGDYLPWCRRVGLSRQTAADYTAVYQHYDAAIDRPAGHMTIKQFLEAVRRANREARREERDALRDAVADQAGLAPPGIELHHCDAREFSWPSGIDLLATDPPWSDMTLYSWLGTMAMSDLRPGGLALIQVGTAYLPGALDALRAAGLTYVWTLAMTHAPGQHFKPMCGRNGGRWLSYLRPVLVMSRGKASSLPVVSVSDVQSVRLGTGEKLHRWEQPLSGWRYWIELLTHPGDLVVDPFAGSGTTAVVAQQTGRKWVGTEVDETAFKVARGRLAGPAAAGRCPP